MRPYSLDFIQKNLETHNNEDISIIKIAEGFRVAKSFVQKLLKQYRETGDIAPRRSGGNPKPKLNEEHLVSLVEIIETNNGARLKRASKSPLGRTAMMQLYQNCASCSNKKLKLE
ncbi:MULTISPECIES: hypothetical protein [unclassified Moorena]|uniref:hypothetical protein n=1 Tax=unclassified Moorena TaxID=2683338 RepID=UPI0013FEC259|nr:MULTISPECIES: hypothetical protein [unclassified Moorena]NEO16812.1 transposase [Moorena sp. SIO3E8]NEQ03390.1 transposase [Moorena sp. SIO3F7]